LFSACHEKNGHFTPKWGDITPQQTMTFLTTEQTKFNEEYQQLKSIL